MLILGSLGRINEPYLDSGNRNPLPLTTFPTTLLSRWAEPKENFSSWARGNQDPLPESLGSGHKKYLAIVGINDVPWMYTHLRKKAKEK